MKDSSTICWSYTYLNISKFPLQSMKDLSSFSIDTFIFRTVHIQIMQSTPGIYSIFICCVLYFKAHDISTLQPVVSTSHNDWGFIIQQCDCIDEEVQTPATPSDRHFIVFFQFRLGPPTNFMGACSGIWAHVHAHNKLDMFTWILYINLKILKVWAISAMVIVTEVGGPNIDYASRMGILSLKDNMWRRNWGLESAVIRFVQLNPVPPSDCSHTHLCFIVAAPEVMRYSIP